MAKDAPGHAGQRLLGAGLRPGRRPVDAPRPGTAWSRGVLGLRLQSAPRSAAKFAVAGDFDGDGRVEIAAAEDISRHPRERLLGDGLRPRHRGHCPGTGCSTPRTTTRPSTPRPSSAPCCSTSGRRVIPSTTATTAIAAHYDRPGTQPPQTMLLVAPPAQPGAWSWDDLVGRGRRDAGPGEDPRRRAGAPRRDAVRAAAAGDGPVGARPRDHADDGPGDQQRAPLRSGPFRPARG